MALICLESHCIDCKMMLTNIKVPCSSSCYKNFNDKFRDAYLPYLFSTLH